MDKIRDLDEFELEFVGRNDKPMEEKSDTDFMMMLANGFLHADGSLR